MLEIGKKAPSFKMEIEGGGFETGQNVGLKDFAGKKLVIFLYPKDDTPGCTKESIGFSEHQAAFEKAGAVILGVSKDTIAKHEKFRAKHDLTIALASDPDGKMIEAYSAWVEKNMYGRKYMGIERSTFLLDQEGKILEIWRKVRVKDHVERVLETVQSHV